MSLMHPPDVILHKLFKLYSKVFYISSIVN